MNETAAELNRGFSERWSRAPESRALFYVVACCAALASAVLCASGRYAGAFVGATTLVVGGILVSRRLSVESLLVGWFITTALASFYFRYPLDRSIITFDRAALVFALAVVIWKRYTGSILNFRVTKFETAWGLLSAVALASALYRSDDLASAVRLAVDSFWLPLLAFHLARHYFNDRRWDRVLIAGVIAMAFFLLATGGIEILTGTDVFQFKGGDITRAHERRVNGPFLADSSYAIICLLTLIFLVESPRALSVKLDGSARLARATAIIAALIGSLLPLFRGIALAMAGCWVVTQLAWLRARATTQAGRRINSRVAWLLLLIPSLIIMLVSTGYLDLSRISSRLGDPTNAVVRLGTWNVAFNVMKSNPIAGVGLTNYNRYFHDTYDYNLDPVMEQLAVKAVDSPHSNFLWIGSELGVPALLLYLLALGWLISSSWRALNGSCSGGKAAGVCSLAMITAYVIPGIELASGYYSALNLNLFFLLGLLANRSSVESAQNDPRQDREQITR